MTTFVEKYEARAQSINSLLSVGLDSEISKLPSSFLSKEYPQYEFNKWIIEETHQYTSCYKFNLAFYEARGEQGWRELKMSMMYLQERHPQLPTIADAKRADIGSTNEAYAKGIFDELGFDAITLHPYLGHEAMQPFLVRQDKGCIFLCRTSNPGAGELQDLMVSRTGGDNLPPQPLWQVVAQQVASEWNEHGNCLLVVGATYPAELSQVRQLVGEMTLLVPGVGAQGGDLAAVLRDGRNEKGLGLIINSSRGIIFADSPAQAAQELAVEMQDRSKND